MTLNQWKLVESLYGRLINSVDDWVNRLSIIWNCFISLFLKTLFNRKIISNYDENRVVVWHPKKCRLCSFFILYNIFLNPFHHVDSMSRSGFNFTFLGQISHKKKNQNPSGRYEERILLHTWLLVTKVPHSLPEAPKQLSVFRLKKN